MFSAKIRCKFTAFWHFLLFNAIKTLHYDWALRVVRNFVFTSDENNDRWTDSSAWVKTTAMK